ncbi:MAG: hypothetical protein JKY65_28415 [Planctomycetes bacterium]|nr:hypothetical protein [Planctomycetota bacterium]
MTTHVLSVALANRSELSDDLDRLLLQIPEMCGSSSRDGVVSVAFEFSSQEVGDAGEAAKRAIQALGEVGLVASRVDLEVEVEA